MTQGLAIFVVGLSAAGKSTLADALLPKLLELGYRATVIDGDVVRRNYSPKLGYSHEERDANLRRIGSMAANAMENGGVAICACIAPYDATRREVRTMLERRGRFVLVYLSTPLAVCEKRDPKKLYARARAGEILAFTGVSDPFEAPSDASLSLDTSTISVDAAANAVLAYLSASGSLPSA